MIAAALLLALATPASDGWTIERKAERCVAIHPFDGKIPGTFNILSRTSTDFDAVVNIELATAPRGWQLIPAKLKLSRDREIASRFGGTGPSPSGGIIVGMPLDRDETAALAASDGVALEVGDDTTVALYAGPLRDVIADLQKCSDGKLRAWGIDPSRLVKSPPGGAAAWFTGDDYPADAKRAGVQGRAMFVATVRQDGAVESCRIVTSSGSVSLDAQTCAVIQRRGRYDATTDRQPRWAIGVIRWAL